jgi:dTDP-glucose pyrophosphorylase
MERLENEQNASAGLTKAILLAAGRGTRLGDLTKDRPKPMVPVNGLPVLEHILLGLKGAGAQEFLLVVGYRAEAIQAYFEDGARWDVAIRYAWQESPNGTGSALLCGREFAGEDTVFASYGDILTSASHYRAMRDNFMAAPCAALIGINPMEDTSAGGAVFREAGSDRITQVVEKPPSGMHSNWNLAGISLYSPAIWPALDAIRPSARGEYELTDAISGLIQSGLEVRAHELHGFWSDVGTPAALAEAERILSSETD